MLMIKVAVVGYGNIGKYAVQAILAASDLELAGVVRRQVREDQRLSELAGIAVVSKISDLEQVDVALLCVPTRSVPAMASAMAAAGINTVDSYDIHGDSLVEYRRQLSEQTKQHGTVGVIAAGWDPGTDSVVRALMEIMAPRGLSFTNFGPGMSMGHTVVVKALQGVEDALSMTIPVGSGVHRRLVYVKLKPQADFAAIKQAIQADPYFQNDETHVFQVGSIEAIQDVGHGVLLERTGTSGRTANQRFKWEMRINNPALTAQVMVAAARASLKQEPGAYTLLEIPLLDYFPGQTDELIQHLV
jgi:diaminopimelate dehydrogenase